MTLVLSEVEFRRLGGIEKFKDDAVRIIVRPDTVGGWVKVFDFRSYKNE